MFLDGNGIKNYIPHRDPFLFLNQIEKVDFPVSIDLLNFSFKDLIGSSVLASYQIDDRHLLANCLGNSLWPNMLLVEAMAQSACFVLNCLESSYGSSGLQVALLSLDQIEFIKAAQNSDQLTIHSTCSKIRGNIATFSSVISCVDEVIAQGHFMASFAFTKQKSHAPGELEDARFD